MEEAISNDWSESARQKATATYEDEDDTEVNLSGFSQHLKDKGETRPLPNGFTLFEDPRKAGAVVGTRAQLKNELCKACWDRDKHKVREILGASSTTANKYRVNAVDCDATPLIHCVRQPCETEQQDADMAEMAQMLFDAGAHVDGGEGTHEVPLILAIIGSGKVPKLKTIQVLLDHGADVRARDGTRQLAPLHWAVICGHLKPVELLLAAGASATTITGKASKPPKESVVQSARRRRESDLFLPQILRVVYVCVCVRRTRARARMGVSLAVFVCRAVAERTLRKYTGKDRGGRVRQAKSAEEEEAIKEEAKAILRTVERYAMARPAEKSAKREAKQQAKISAAVGGMPSARSDAAAA